MQTDEPFLRTTIFWWEKRRLVYNIIMLMVGTPLAINAYSGHALEVYTLSVVEIGFCANACFCFGPFVDIYLRGIFRLDITTRGRQGLFISGLFFSLLAIGFIWFAEIDGILPSPS